MDLENYGVSGDMWSVSYPGNLHDVATTRAKMFQRGQEIAPIFASVGNVVIYTSSIAAAPGSYQDAVQANDGSGAMLYVDNMFPDFLRGPPRGGCVGHCHRLGVRGRYATPAPVVGRCHCRVGRAHGRPIPRRRRLHHGLAENGSSSAEAVAIASRLSTGPVVIYQQHLTDGGYDYGPYLKALRAESRRSSFGQERSDHRNPPTISLGGCVVRGRFGVVRCRPA